VGCYLLTLAIQWVVYAANPSITKRCRQQSAVNTLRGKVWLPKDLMALGLRRGFTGPFFGHDQQQVVSSKPRL
jgi:hypothetical protein